ncbi:MAG TPA: transglycosylase domain-containing protein [Nocardioides sp.]|jgi:membrane peptidoglycan carboxypeptidase|uniref:penicillin-binding protein n=1 Tax=Nocardioides sp. TaxID=35761 RepID=UPI002E36E794|nr:transglycosylase domain-containing protein [Nocardioides sp.]HEX3931366.1 transglycosylase domain-containing protein [Nocardioides sp.]
MAMPREERLPTSRILSHLGVMAAVAAVMGVVVAGLAIPFAGVFGIASKKVSQTVESLPADLRTQPLAQQTKIVDQQGQTIATLYDENRVNVPLNSVSRKMVKSIVAIEDYRFYQHGALDLKGTLRALVTNQSSGGVVQGGSSITQQMVKMTLLAQAKTKAERKEATADTYARKLTELRYAIAFEQHYSKDWILERYLNIAYFGDGAYGVQAAARHYFGVNAKDLTWVQGATLAGLVKNPTGYDPLRNPDRGMQRRNVVLDRLAQLHVISQHKADKYKKQPLGLHPVPTPNGCINSTAPFFCDYVVHYLEQDPALGKTVAARSNLLKTGGLVIHTTIDPRFQTAADNSVRHHVFAQNQAIGALAMVQPGTGDVKALAQSRPMGSDAAAGQTYINYTVPQQYGDSAGFQPGSTFKAFVLATAIQQGIPLTETINAPPEVKIPMSQYRVCHGQHFESTDTWDVHTSTTSGSMNLYQGTQNSVNPFFAKLELQTGLCEPFHLANEMGMDLTDKATELVPSFTLGVASISPLQLADAYATWAARGLYCAPRPVTSIDDSDGHQLKTYPEQCKQVVAAPVADAVNSVLEGVMAPGGFGENLLLNQQAAAKTGTNNDNMSVWFMGYTPNLATASMIAGANRLGHWVTLNQQTIGGVYTDVAHGSTTAGPMWYDAMKIIQQWLPDARFTPPSGEDVNGVLTSVPDVGGETYDAASRQLKAAGFTVVNGGQRDSGYPQGTVAYTSPGAGGQVASGTSITVYLSDGTPAPPPGHHHHHGGHGHH